MGKIQKMIDYAVNVANDDSHGYSQVRRWPDEGSDFDCSSLMYESANQAGFNVKLGWPRYTGTMLNDFQHAGFTAIPFDGNLSDLDPGDILLNVSQHTEMYIGNGQFVGAHCSETGGTDGAPGDQTGNEISIVSAYTPSYGWDYVLMPPRDAEPEPTPAPTPAPSSKTRLNGIDIASWQAGIDIEKVDADFVIVKVSGGTNYVNPYWREWANRVLASGKLLGLYHYACEYGSEPGGKAEADFFLEQCSDFIGKAIFFLDWEAHATYMPVSYAKAFLDRVAKKTGSTPMFYGYASNINGTDYSAIKKYPLWMASYLDRYSGGHGYVKNPVNTWDTGAWDGMVIYQYSSTRTIDGYGGNLDCNMFYGSREDWAKYANGKPSPAPTPTPTKDDGPKFCVCAGGQWLDPMVGTRDTGGSSDDFGGILGKAMQYIAISGVGKYRVCTAANGWLPWVSKYDPSNLEYGCAGDGSAIIALEIPNKKVRYALHNRGGSWNSDMVGNKDTGGSSDKYAGAMVPADAARIVWA